MLQNEPGEKIRNGIYSGVVKHQRYVDARHAFEFQIYMLWLRVSEVDHPSHGWPMITRGRFGLISLLASDYMAHRPEASLAGRLEAEIFQKLGQRWKGEAFLLAQPRHLGFVMNPLALYYCYGSDEKLEFVVGEITNTPWAERHCYVFDMRQSEDARPVKFNFKKDFHVSPFLPMDMDYTWMLNAPAENLTVNIWNKVGERLDFEAHLNLLRAGLTRVNLLMSLVKMPLVTWKIWLGIYINAAILYAIKRVTFYSHPKKCEAKKEGSK